MRVIYDTTEDCTHCPYNTGRVCMKLGKYLFDICFETDCPLPLLEQVEQFTMYVTEKKSLKCHGNCRYWERWDYNKHIMADVGFCESNGVKRADGEACKEFEEL